MVRRTKAQALATRSQLLAAAQDLFARNGVSGTSLQQIAQAAGATRGAVYWHFRNKADVFNAMMEQAILPMEQAMQRIGHDPDRDPLRELHAALIGSLQTIAEDAAVQQIFDIATLKVEYVGEMAAVRQRHLQACTDVTRETARSLQEAAARRGLTLPVPAEVAAQGVHATVAGLIHTWMLEPRAFALVPVAAAALHTHWLGLGLLQPHEALNC